MELRSISFEFLNHRFALLVASFRSICFTPAPGFAVDLKSVSTQPSAAVASIASISSPCANALTASVITEASITWKSLGKKNLRISRVSRSSKINSEGRNSRKPTHVPDFILLLRQMRKKMHLGLYVVRLTMSDKRQGTHGIAVEFPILPDSCKWRLSGKVRRSAFHSVTRCRLKPGRFRHSIFGVRRSQGYRTRKS